MRNEKAEVIPINDFKDFNIGNAQNIEAGTGCTAVICKKGALAGVDVRGGSPGTRETDLLNPCCMNNGINAVMLAGGSAFGLDAAGGAMRFLEERGIGLDVGVTKVPIVSSAILFDLKCGNGHIRPDAEMGYKACEGAFENNFCEGNFGAGTGATVGKIKGVDFAMKSGVGAKCFQLGSLKVGAVVAVNCVGDVLDSEENRIIAGTLNSDKKTFADSEKLLLNYYNKDLEVLSNGNTVIGAVITNAKMAKGEVNKLAAIAQNGIVRAVRPANSNFDGDTVFSMSSCEVNANFDAVGVLAAHAMERAVVSAVKHALPAYGYAAHSDINL